MLRALAELSQLFALVSLTQKLKVPAKFELIAGEKGEPEPIMGGFPTEGSLSYQFKVPPDPFAVKLGITSPIQIVGGEIAFGIPGAPSIIILIVAAALSHPVALVSLTQKLKVPAIFELIAGEKGEPEPIMGGFPIEGSLSYQFNVPPDPFAVKLGIASFTQIVGGETAFGIPGASSIIILKIAAVLSHPVVFVSVTQIGIFPGILVLTKGINGLPFPIGMGLPIEGSLSYQLIVPPLPFAVTLGGASSKQIGLG